MTNFKVLVAREISKDNLEIAFSKEYERKTNPEIEASIQKIWERELTKNPRLFPGLKFRLIDAREINEKVKIFLGITNYKDFIGTNLSENLKSLMEKGRREGDENLYLSSPLGNMCVVQTSDNKIVFFKRSQEVSEYKGFIDVPGGHPEPEGAGITPDNISYEKSQEDIKDALFASPEEELIAELNISQADIEKITCIGFIINREIGNKPDIIFYVKLNLSSKDLKKLYDEGAEESFESTGIIFANKAELKDFISKNNLTPAALAALECYQKLNIS